MLVQRPFPTFHICARGKESVFNLSDSSSADTYQLDNRGGGEGRGGGERRGEGKEEKGRGMVRGGKRREGREGELNGVGRLSKWELIVQVARWTM